MATAVSSLAPLLDPTPDILAAHRDYAAAMRRLHTAKFGRGAAYHEAIVEADQAFEAFRAAVPMQLGWYRLGDKLWGWTKVDWSGLTFVERPVSLPVDHPARGRYHAGLRRRGLVK